MCEFFISILSLPLPVEVTLTLETDEVRVAENSRSVKVEIRKEGDCERPVSVRVYTESGSAKGIYSALFKSIST